MCTSVWSWDRLISVVNDQGMDWKAKELWLDAWPGLYMCSMGTY